MIIINLNEEPGKEHMNKLRIEGNNYYNDLRKNYGSGCAIFREDIQEVLDFAYDMCFGAGHHRNHRTGGIIRRRAGEQFCNTFQGKLAEVALRKRLIYYGVNCAEPDFNVFGEGIWDDCDLIVNGKSISVKSAAFFSNLLLLESKDYDANGNYLPNLENGSTSSYDYYVLVRIKPDIKGLFRRNRLMYCDEISKSKIEEIINSEWWSFDIGGWVNHAEFVSVIRDKNIIPQGAKLNGKIPMDADNYYIQSGDMHKMHELVKELK